MVARKHAASTVRPTDARKHPSPSVPFKLPPINRRDLAVTGDATAKALRPPIDKPIPKVRRGMIVFDALSGKLVTVVEMLPEACIVQGDHGRRYELEWSHVAAPVEDADTPGFLDPESVAELGGDPFYRLAGRVALMQKRMEVEIRRLALDAAEASLSDEIEKGLKVIDDHLNSVVLYLEEISGNNHVPFLLGTWRKPAPPEATEATEAAAPRISGLPAEAARA